MRLPRPTVSQRGLVAEKDSRPRQQEGRRCDSKRHEDFIATSRAFFVCTHARKHAHNINKLRDVGTTSVLVAEKY